MSQGDGVGTRSPTWTTPISGHGQQFDICFPSYYQVPIDVTAKWSGHHPSNQKIVGSIPGSGH